MIVEGGTFRFLGRILLVSHPLYDRFALIVSACCMFVCSCFFFNLVNRNCSNDCNFWGEDTPGLPPSL